MELKYEIYKECGNLCKPNNGWTKELNLISWSSREPVYDIRAWSENHEKMGKGVTLTIGELKALKELLNGMEL